MSLSKGFSTAVSGKTPSEKESSSRPTLLVVDDEREITASLADQFRREYRVLTAHSVDEALDILGQEPVSVLVADQRMPEKTGSELLAEAFRIDPDIVRILLTGYADIESVIQAVNQGKIFFYITKPWSSEELGAIVAKAMEHHFLILENKKLVEELRIINARLEERIKERTLQLEQRALELEAANQKISELVYIDALTGAANRRRLDETMAVEIERAERLGLPLTVILLDVDHFKLVNDDFGHALGDKVLLAIAEVLMKSVRKYDLVARYGGEEFLVMLPGTVLKNGAVSAERFRKTICELTIPGVSREVSASFGVAELSKGDSSTALFEKADKALYRAKKGGRNRVETEND